MSCNCQCQYQEVLLVDAREPICVEIAGALQQGGFSATQIAGLDEAGEVLSAGGCSAVIIHHSAAADGLVAFCREARSDDERLVVIPVLTGCDEKLELELFDGGVDDVVTDRHTPQAVAKRLAVRLRRRS